LNNESTKELSYLMRISVSLYSLLVLYKNQLIEILEGRNINFRIQVDNNKNYKSYGYGFRNSSLPSISTIVYARDNVPWISLIRSIQICRRSSWRPKDEKQRCIIFKRKKHNNCDYQGLSIK
jgi:hypothetical protein